MKRRLQQGKNHRKSVLTVTTALLLVAIVSAGCSDSGKGPSPSSLSVPKSAQQAITKGTATVAEVKSEPVFTYNPVGRRDPFAPILVKEEIKSKLSDRPPLERYSVYEFKMTGIIWGGFGYNAMLEGPDGKGYLVRKGTVIGPNKGVVKTITPSSLVIEEKFKSISGGSDHKEIVIELQKKQEGIQ